MTDDAVTDDLTGLYNARYFRHFLSRIVDKARTMHFPVTLLLFDIDGTLVGGQKLRASIR